MFITDETYLDYSDVLIRPQESKIKSRNDVSLISPKLKNIIPIISSNMDTVSTFEAADVLLRNNMACALHKHYTPEEYIEYFKKNKSNGLFYTIGAKDEDYDKLAYFVQKACVPNICIDVANGYIPSFHKFITKVRETYPEAFIMAGNVATPYEAKQVIWYGADMVKVGISGGAQCTTRLATGVGVPQLSAVLKCSEALGSIGGLLCADGGITCPGDVAKAFGAGADMVMIGSEFSGHDESGGDIIYDENMTKVGRQVYGMSSSTAQNKHNGGLASYRSSEGRTSIVPYRGRLQDTIDYYLGGLRSAMTYINCPHIDEMSTFTTFIRVNNQINNTYHHSTVTVR